MMIKNRKHKTPKIKKERTKRQDPNLKEPTIVEVAKETGYSIATISRVINNFTNVKPSTRKIVQEAIKKLDYVPNNLARNLVQGSSKEMNIIFPSPEITHMYFSKSFWLAFETSGYHVNNYYSFNDVVRENNLIQAALGRRVSGIALSPIRGNLESINRLKESRTPFIVFNYYIEDPEINNIYFDFYSGIKSAVESLLLKGKKSYFQVITSQKKYYHNKNNILLKVIKEKNLSVDEENFTIFCEETIESAYTQTKEFLESCKNNQPSAIFTSTDSTTIGVISACKDLGINIPEEISIVGNYNTPISQHYIPRISTIEANLQTLTNEVAKFLLDESTVKNSNFIKPKITKSVLSTNFIERETT